ncbi:TPA: hypothetical protein SMG08_004550 [Serratia marcescens]|uniref:hypothetical protein n=1 Tax=Serratia sp. CY66712 TaxID=3383659 RepID=UPI0029E61685|nr:hypothetical protein [Serratia marcescens]
MIDRQKLEMAVIEIAKQNGEQIDRYTLYTIRNDIRNALEATSRHKQRMSSNTYQWERPKTPRR